MYPRFLYHKDEAPSGRLIRNAEDEPTGPGWVDTPQKFDPAYVEPAPVVPEGSVPADRPGYVPQQYPSHRYGASGEVRVVASAEEDAELNPRDWKHSPADFLAEIAPAEPAPKPRAVARAVTPPPPAPDVPPADPAVPPPAKPMNAKAMKASLYDAKEADVIAQVREMGDIEKLQIVKGFEETNPKKRAKVIKAVDKRLAELGYVPPAES